jgi:hypothetical protein
MVEGNKGSRAKKVEEGNPASTASAIAAAGRWPLRFSIFFLPVLKKVLSSVMKCHQTFDIRS